MSTLCYKMNVIHKLLFTSDLPEYGLLAKPSRPGIAAVVPGNVTP